MDELKIKVGVEGKEQLDALWEKFEQGGLTLKEVTALKKQLNAAFTGEIMGTADYNKFAGQLGQINNLQRDVRIETKAGHEAYFKAGLEVRQLALSSGILKGALGGATNELANSVLNAVQLKQVLVPLGISMGGVSIALVALVAMLPSMISLFSKSADETERNAKAMQLWSDVVKDMDINNLNNELDRLQKLLAEILANNANLMMGGGLLGAILMGIGLGTSKEEIDALIKRIDEVQKKLKEMNREQDKKAATGEDNRTKIDEYDKLREASSEYVDALKKEQEVEDARQRGYEMDEADRKVAKRMKELQGEKKEIVSFSNFAQQTLGNAFSGVFQQAGADLRQFLGVEGHSVIQLLIADVAQLALKFAEMAAIAGFLSVLFPGLDTFGSIFGGLSGIPLSGKSSGGGTVPDVTRNAVMSRSNARERNDSIAGGKIQLIARGPDLVAIMDTNEQLRGFSGAMIFR